MERKRIGFVRHLTHYNPTNELSQQRLADLAKELNVSYEILCHLPRYARRSFAKAARKVGYDCFFFEKGTGR